MRRLALILIAGIISISTSAKEGKFSGNITGLGSAEIDVWILPLKQGEEIIQNKITCRNGKFDCHVSFNSDMWHLVRLESKDFRDERPEFRTLKSQSITFFMQPGDEISVSAKISDYGINYKVYGNEINTQRNEFSNKIFPLEEEYNRLIISKEKSVTSGQNRDRDELESTLTKVSNQIKELKLDIIGDHPDWIYSAELIAEFPLDTISRYFEKFTPDVKNSFFGRHVSKLLNEAQIGSSAPGFTLRNEKEEDISISNYRGKYTVLYFWGTWCGVCIKGIPKMNEYHSRYSDKVEFISISCRDSKDNWLKAIEKNKMNWVNLIAQNSEVSDKYGVEGYPTKIIIDPSGTIIHKSVGNTNEFYNKMDDLFSMKN